MTGTAEAAASNGTHDDTKHMTNPSFVLAEKHKVRYEDRPVPEMQIENDVIVQVKFTGICGSDVHYWHAGAIGQFVLTSPMVLGHESSGIIHAVNNSSSSKFAHDLKPGDKVAIEPGVPCRVCPACKRGKYNLCPAMTFAATPPHDGTLCRYYRVPADFCYKLPAHVSLEEGALVEPLTVAVHIVRQADVRPASSVVVFGAGPVGLLCVAVARAYGAEKVVSVDVNEARVKFALEYAATGAFRPRKEESAAESAARMVAECEFGEGPDVAIDASGAEVCMQTAVHALRMGGTYVQGGMGKDEVTWPVMAMCTKELTVKGSFRYGPDDYKTAISLLGQGRVDVKKLISKQVGFWDAEQAFVDTKEAKGIKILIEGPE